MPCGVVAVSVRPGRRVVAGIWPPTVWATDGSLLANVTDDDWTVGSPEVGVPFVAPASGVVEITTGGGARSDAAPGDRIWMTPFVFEGSNDTGAEVLGSSQSHRWGISQYGSYQYGDKTFPLDGLTPGQTYYAQHRYQRSGTNGTAEITRRTISVRPAT